MAQQANFTQIAATRLDATLREREPQVFVQSLKEVIRASGGFTAVARKTGLHRTSLYDMLSPSGNPKLSTLIVLLHGIGLRLAIEPLVDPQSGESKAINSD